MKEVQEPPLSRNPYQHNGEPYAHSHVLESSRNTTDEPQKKNKRVYIESYGCQMNFSDSEIVASILAKAGFSPTQDMGRANLILLNTCSIREKAEQTITHRLAQINHLKKHNPALLVGVLGCMAERIKKKMFDNNKFLDLVVGPDAYRDLPKLVEEISEGNQAVNTLLSREETYADITPLRLNPNNVTAFLSIMRGCDNMCSFCVVPFTRGRERSRNPKSIVDEASTLFEQGYREITLLGQNVDSYTWSSVENNKARLKKIPDQPTVLFADLLNRVAQIHPDLRIRFSTSHPRDITDEVLYIMAKHKNICKHIHLPLQSGNNRILELMNRGYTREWYIKKVKRIREILGSNVGISSDIIAGFCTESEEEHQDTLTAMKLVHHDFSYMFCYSERPGTPAAKKMRDDVPLAVKKRRLAEIIETQRQLSLQRNQRDIGKKFSVLIEGRSKRSEDYLQGRNSANKMIVFPKQNKNKGEYADVFVEKCTGATLLGEIIH